MVEGSRGLRDERIVGKLCIQRRYKTLREEESNKESIDGSFIESIIIIDNVLVTFLTSNACLSHCHI